MRIDFAALDAAIAEKVEKKPLPGCAVCLCGPDGIVFSKGYGFCDEEKTRPVNEDTMFGVASMSKSTATLALCMLEAEGRFSFDDPVIKYFPKFSVPGNPPESVLIRHLAMHTAGIPPLETLEWSILMNTPSICGEFADKMRASAPNRFETIDEVIDYVASGAHPSIGMPGEHMSYSNDDYAILCSIFDMAAGETLERFLKRRVFGPLGMTRTVLDYDGSEARALSGGNITDLFELRDGVLKADDHWETMPPFRACAQVKSTAKDMARYYQCLSNRGRLDGEQLLPAAAIELLCGSGFPLQKRPFYCYGLYKQKFLDHAVCYHSGGLHGVSTHGGFLLDEGVSFAALSNIGGADTDDIDYLMLNACLGLPLDTSHEWLLPKEGMLKNPDCLAGRFVGYEELPEVITFQVDNGKISADKDGEPYDLVWGGGTWFLAYRNGELQTRLHVEVRDGRAWGVRTGSRVFMREDA